MQKKNNNTSPALRVTWGRKGSGPTMMPPVGKSGAGSTAWSISSVTSGAAAGALPHASRGGSQGKEPLIVGALNCEGIGNPTVIPCGGEIRDASSRTIYKVMSDDAGWVVMQGFLVAGWLGNQKNMRRCDVGGGKSAVHGAHIVRLQNGSNPMTSPAITGIDR